MANPTEPDIVDIEESPVFENTQEIVDLTKFQSLGITQRTEVGINLHQ